jgi:hypothetical protein
MLSSSIFIEAQIKFRKGLTHKEGMNKQLIAEIRTLVMVALICHIG